ncbi:hypothetical protein [Lewinella sp. LCG006]|uniref:hypothetical protein n=1 Tax=Lewinella sp. LCG006 TaxID=3231911 RepID=UPI00345FBC14
MFLKKLSLPFVLIAFSLLMIQCTTSSTPDDVPTIDVYNTDLMGLDAKYTTTVVAKFTQGVPTTTLSMEEFQTMFQQVAQTTQELDGSLVNYYVEAKEGGPNGQDYFLILNGELADGTYLKSGFLLTSTSGGMTIASSIKGRPVHHFSCRGSFCNNCTYVYNLNGVVDCGCATWGINDCYKYYPDQDPT